MGSAGSRCEEHQGRDATAAARAVAATLRRRGPDRPDTPGRSETPISDAQIAGIADSLNRHGVAYVFVGGAAAQLHGAPVMRTRDADIVPSKAPDNLTRLGRALRQMEARLWVAGEPDGLAMTFDRRSLGQIERFLNLVTKHGPLDITYQPDGTAGFDDLARSSVLDRLLDVDVIVASLTDVIRSKEAAGRAKDIAALPALIEHARRAAPDS